MLMLLAAHGPQALTLAALLASSPADAAAAAAAAAPHGLHAADPSLWSLADAADVRPPTPPRPPPLPPLTLPRPPPLPPPCRAPLPPASQEDFMLNMQRYARFTLSTAAGMAYIVAKPVADLLKRGPAPRAAPRPPRRRRPDPPGPSTALRFIRLEPAP